MIPYYNLVLGKLITGGRLKKEGEYVREVYIL
jgi:hypothetical protein